MSVGIFSIFVGRFQLLGSVWFFAPSIVIVISIFLLWMHYHVGKLQLTDKRAIKYGGLFGDPPTAVWLKEIETIRLKTDTWWEQKFQLPTILIEGGDPMKETRLKKVADAKRFEVILRMLKKKAELGLSMHAPLPADVAREELKDWRL